MKQTFTSNCEEGLPSINQKAYILKYPLQSVPITKKLKNLMRQKNRPVANRQLINKKSNLDYTYGITPKRVTIDRDYLRALTPVGKLSEKTSQR